MCFLPRGEFFDDIPPSNLTLTADVEEPWLLFQDPLPVTDSPHTTTTTTTVQLPSPRPTARKKTKEKKETQEQAQQRKIDVKYDALPDTQQYEVSDG